MCKRKTGYFSLRFINTITWETQQFYCTFDAECAGRLRKSNPMIFSVEEISTACWINELQHWSSIMRRKPHLLNKYDDAGTALRQKCETLESSWTYLPCPRLPAPRPPQSTRSSWNDSVCAPGQVQREQDVKCERGAVRYLMVELLRIAQRQLVPHVGVVAHSHEVVIPRALDINMNVMWRVWKGWRRASSPGWGPWRSQGIDLTGASALSHSGKASNPWGCCSCPCWFDPTRNQRGSICRLSGSRSPA